MTSKYETISGTIEKEISDLIEDIMWEVNDAARKKDVKYPKCNVSKVLRVLLKHGVLKKEKVVQELLDEEINQWKKIGE